MVSAENLALDGLLRPPKTEWPPQGTSSIFPVTRDTFLSSVDDERNGSNGREEKLKVKSLQEYALIDIDGSPLKGEIIRGALLHLRSASPEKAPLARITVSTVASPWVEGSSSRYREEFGSSSFNQAEYKKRDWAYPGSTFMDVSFGRGHTKWKFSDCSRPDDQGWQACAVDPDVIAARIAGLSYGFGIYDDVGSTWSINKNKFRYHYFPNRFFYSRESGDSSPRFEVWTSGRDIIPPGKIQSIKVNTEGFPAGEALVSWKTPEDSGVGKTLGFQVSYRQGHKTQQMPRYLIPMAGEEGEEVRMHIQDLPLQAGEKILLEIRPVDSVGNVGPVFKKSIRLSVGGVVTLPRADLAPFPPNRDLLKVAEVQVAVIDLLDKINPKTGKMIPARKQGYKGGNHLFSARKKRIRLQSAKNETVYFQINFEGKAEHISVDYSFKQHQVLQAKIYQFAYVNIRNKRRKVILRLPDPLVPLDKPFSIPSKVGETQVPGQTNHSLIFELYVPHNETAGRKRGKVTISIGDEQLEIDVDLTVWNFTLPNKLSFVPEMNAYHTVSPDKGYEYYRLAHEHRTTINRLPYGWHGLSSFFPAWENNEYEWSEWDKSSGPLLDGTAFEGLPRSGEPVDVFYLPFSENWPVSIFDHYRPSYWADEAFSESYKNELSRGFSAFAKHLNEKEWHDTIFQFYLNNKVMYRRKFKRSSAPWILDEPMNTQDFWAIRWYGLLWHGAVDSIKGDAKMWYRGDISFSQFGRNILWDVMDVEYLGGNNAQKVRMKRDEQILRGKAYFSEYGTANKIETPNTQPVFWSLYAWSNGASGVLPWQTIGNKRSWKLAQQTALFYPHKDGPIASVRLKAFSVGQQFVEYLTFLSELNGQGRFTVGKWLIKSLDLEPNIKKRSINDAGTAVFEAQDLSKLWALRYRIGKMISEKEPPYRRSLLNFDTLTKEEKEYSDIGYVHMSPQVPRYEPSVDSFKP